MNIDLKQYLGRCSCGKNHRLLTNEIIIEARGTNRLSDLAKSLKLNTRGVIVCDTNTHPFAEGCSKILGGYLLENHGIITLDAKNLHADEKATGILSKTLPGHAGWLLAVGSGTIHDITRYVAHERGIDFISYPTAATVDGFVSSVSAMTWYGFKKTLPGIAPLAVVADTDIFAAASYHLTAAGIGDALGKYTSLADWEIGHLVTGEEFCPRIAAITRKAAEKVRGSLAAIRSGNPEGVEQLMFALSLSGIGMQMWGNSRPASGAEHHLSHLWEMECITPHIDALHGEKVGVGLCLALAEYHRIAALTHVEPCTSYDGIPHNLLRGKLGGLYEDIVRENTPDPLLRVDIAKLKAVLPRIRELLSALPGSAEMAAEMEAAGCHATLSQIGLPDSIESDSLCLSPYVRNRLTFMRLRKLLNMGGKQVNNIPHNADPASILRDIRCLALDMDGTIYLGQRWIDGAKDFLRAVESSGRQYVFMTNNSSKNRAAYLEKLARMGLDISESQLVTSGHATIHFLLRNHPGKGVYLLGSPMLRQEFAQAGIRLEDTRPDLVVTAYDTTLDYAKLCAVCDFVREGLPYYGTHPDLNCPTETGILPDIGSFHALIETSTGRRPDGIIGKPNREIIDYMLGVTGSRREQTAVVGDRLYTDVASGVNNGLTGILVLSGEVKLGDLPVSDVQPHLIFDSVKEMIPYL